VFRGSKKEKEGRRENERCPDAPRGGERDKEKMKKEGEGIGLVVGINLGGNGRNETWGWGGRTKVRSEKAATLLKEIEESRRKIALSFGGVRGGRE